MREAAVAAYKDDISAMLYLEHMADGEPRLKELLVHSVARVLSTQVEPGKTLLWHLTRNDTAIDHIWDWLQASLINDVPWLSNLDVNGCPKKLAKCQDLAALMREADKDMRKQNAAIARKPLAEGDEVLEFQCEDGWSIVRLLTPGALDRESAEMQHCIGHGAYDDRLDGDENLFLSLRSPRGRAHATVHIENKTVVQISGKQNAIPVSRYFLRIASYLTSQGFYLGDICTGQNGWIVDMAGNLYPMDGLPDELRVPGNVYIKGNAPSSIIAGGNVVVALKEGERPPVKIETSGGISLVGNGFKVAPRIRCGGELVVRSTMIETLPRGISVKGLTVTSTPIRTLPDDIVNVGNLYLDQTGLVELPESLWQGVDGKSKSHGHVHIFNTPVSTLGSLAIVSGDLVLVSTACKSMPDGLEVAGNLRISSRDAVEFKISKRLTVNGSINIDVSGTLTFLGDDIRVPNAVSVCGENIRFPRHVSCGSLSVVGSTVRTMPRMLLAQDSFNLGDTEIDRLPAHIEASKIGVRRAKLTSFLGRLRGLSGFVRANTIMVDDGPLKIGSGVTADEIKIVDENLSCVTMTVGQARSYLGAHKRYARLGGMPAFAKLTCAPLNKAGSALEAGEFLLYFMGGGKGVNGRPVVYDEFHRSAQ
jgi:hypothetical protein